MKNLFKLFSIVMALSVVLTGCSKDDANNGNGNNSTDEKVAVQLAISAVIDGTRASTEGDETATAEEIAVDATKGVKVAIFNTDEKCVYASELSLEADGANYKTPVAEAISLNNGNYYFFVFANDKTAATGKIILPTTGQDMSAWMAGAFAVEYSETTSGSGLDKLDIATNDASTKFLLGTLWKSVSVAEGGGTAASPKVVDITIGRLSSKVLVKSMVTTSTTMKGKFSNMQYRMGTLAKAITNAGVAAKAPYGSTAANTMVTSAKHNAPHVLSGGAFNTTDFEQYSAFKTLAATNNTTFFYVTENTTGRQDGEQATNAQFYGNTTYIQIESVYTPDLSEIYKFVDNAATPENLTDLVLEAVDAEGNYWAGNAGDMTFWSFGEGANRILLTVEPTTPEQFAAIPPPSTASAISELWS